MTQSVENSREDVELLQQLSSILSKHFQKTIECKYIPDGMDEQSQMQILQVISHIGNEGDSISLDVTHGFRHLPMLELLSAFLKDEGGEVGHIYYGAFDPFPCACGLRDQPLLRGARKHSLQISEQTTTESLLQDDSHWKDWYN